MEVRRMDTGRYWDEGIDLVSGCTPVSPGCDHCWHRAALARYRKQDPDQVIVHPERLHRLREGKPRIVAIWADLFHPAVPDDFIAQTLDAAAAGPCEVLILTKRPERMAWATRHMVLPDNVWPGVTVESQDHVDRLWWLRKIDSRNLWVSVEPILSTVVLDVRSSASWLSWVVVGCETGPGPRLTPETNLHIRSVAVAASSDGIPVWVKCTVGPRGRPTTDIGDRAWIRREKPEYLAWPRHGEAGECAV
jgi:protein gp37